MKSVFPIPALVLLALTGLPLAAHAACPTDLEAAAVAAAIVARQPVPVPAGEMSVADGLCGRDKVVRYLAQISGPVVGYKAGLTNLAVQQRFKHDAPLPRAAWGPAVDLLTATKPRKRTPADEVFAEFRDGLPGDNHKDKAHRLLGFLRGLVEAGRPMGIAG